MSVNASRFLREKNYIAVWPGDDNPCLRFAGEEILVPRANEVAEAKRGPFKFGSVKDAAGRAIPGTLLLSDVYSDNGEKVSKVFDAEDFLNGLHAVNEALVARGLRVVYTIEEIEPARREGRQAWEEAQQISDEETLRIELSRQARWSQKNPDLPVPRGSDDAAVRSAIERLRSRNVTKPAAVKRDDLVAALGGNVTATPAITAADFDSVETVTPKAPAEPAKDEGPSIEAIAQHLFEMAEEHSITLTKAELKGLLGKDAASMESVRSKLEEAGVAL